MSQEDLLAYAVGYVPEKMAKKARLFDFTETDFPQGFGFNPTIRYKTNVNGSIPFAFITRPVRNIDYKTVGTISKLSGSPKLLMTGNINLNNASTAPSGAFVTKYNHEAVRAQRISSVGEGYSQSPLTMALQVSYGIVACQEPDLTTAMVKAPEIEEDDEDGLIIISGQDVLTCNFEYTLRVGKDKVPITLNKEWWEQNPDGEFRFIQDVSGGCYWGCRFIIEKIYSSFVWGFNDYSAAFIGEDYLQHTHDMSETNLGRNIWRSVSTSSGFWRNHANWPDRGLQGISNNHSVNNNSMATDLGEDGLFVRWWQTSTYQGYAVFKGWTPTDYFLKLALAAPTFYVEGTADTATWYTAEYDKNCCLTGNIIPVNEVKNNWQLDMTPNNNTFDGVTMPEPSPEPPNHHKPVMPSADAINLWSYKRDNVSPLVAGIFPYNGGDAGDGEFIGMIRSKLTSDVVRDENGKLKINSLEIYLEDVIRESAGEKSLIGFLQVPEPNLNSDDAYGAYTKYFKNDNLSAAQNEILDINLQSGFYQGEVCSYISTSNPVFTITVKKKWIDAPAGVGEYTATVICENSKTGEVMEQEVSNTGAGTIRFSNLRAYDDENHLINYAIYERQPDNFPWTSVVTNDEINYESELKTAIIENKWNLIIDATRETIISKVFVNDYFAALDSTFHEDIYPETFSEITVNDHSKAEVLADNTGVDNFLTFLKTEGKDAWINIVMESSEYKQLPEKNSAALFCAKFIWHQYYKEDNPTSADVGKIEFSSWHEITPFFTIVVRNSDGEEQFYSFSVELDDDGGTELNEIPYPYVSSRVGDSKGVKSTVLQWKRGAKVFPDLDPTNHWGDGVSAFNGELTYSGQPTNWAGPAPYYYTTGNIVYGSIDISTTNDDIKLRNFCIYLADRMCMDSSTPTDLVGYYYQMYLKTPVGEDNYGVLGMKIQSVPKTEGFDSGEEYKYHKWETDVQKCPYVDTDQLPKLQIKITKLTEDLEKPGGLFYDFINAPDNYKSIFGEEDDN